MKICIATRDRGREISLPVPVERMDRAWEPRYFVKPSFTSHYRNSKVPCVKQGISTLNASRRRHLDTSEQTLWPSYRYWCFEKNIQGVFRRHTRASWARAAGPGEGRLLLFDPIKEGGWCHLSRSCCRIGRCDMALETRRAGQDRGIR